MAFINLVTTKGGAKHECLTNWPLVPVVTARLEPSTQGCTGECSTTVLSPLMLLCDKGTFKPCLKN